ncbi:MAG: gliding motility lipoprotein GldD, partial [Bacteroidetes bacterium 4572_77]
TLLNDVHNMMNKHIPKANAINENMYLNPIQHVYGLTYDIQGSQAASPFQFYVTDSTQHFFRGALYFNFTPNNDSLQPVIDYLKKDIQVLIESLEWK